MKGARNGTVAGGGQAAFKREAVAYAVGHTEEWVRQFADGLGIPFAQVAAGVSGALAVAGNRAGVPVLPLRGGSPVAPEVLQPEMAVDRGAREHVRTTRKVDGRTVRGIQRSRKAGLTREAIAKRLHVSVATVDRYKNAA